MFVDLILLNVLIDLVLYNELDVFFLVTGKSPRKIAPMKFFPGLGFGLGLRGGRGGQSSRGQFP